jgi:hypothetical protein
MHGWSSNFEVTLHVGLGWRTPVDFRVGVDVREVLPL